MLVLLSFQKVQRFYRLLFSKLSFIKTMFLSKLIISFKLIFVGESFNSLESISNQIKLDVKYLHL